MEDFEEKENYNNENSDQDFSEFPEEAPLGELPENNTDRQKKIFAFTVLIGGIIIVVFGFLRIRSGLILKNPLMEHSGNININVQEEIDVNNLSDEELKSRDTDKDGLSDYEEQYIYNTSAYLDDTDSDGKKDLAEINSGSNPLCDESAGDCSTEGYLSPPFSDSNLFNPASTSTPESFQNYSAEQLRTILKNAGISGEILKAVSDEELMNLYKDIANNPQAAEEIQPSQKDLLNVPSPAEIRKLLIEGGVDENLVNSLSDDTIISTYQSMAAK